MSGLSAVDCEIVIISHAEEEPSSAQEGFNFAAKIERHKSSSRQGFGSGRRHCGRPGKRTRSEGFVAG